MSHLDLYLFDARKILNKTILATENIKLKKKRTVIFHAVTPLVASVHDMQSERETWEQTYNDYHRHDFNYDTDY